MSSVKDIEPITELERNAAGLIEQAKTSRSPIVITQNGRATAVLQDVQSFESQRQSLLLLKLVAQGELAYREGRVLSHEQLTRRMAERLTR